MEQSGTKRGPYKRRVRLEGKTLGNWKILKYVGRSKSEQRYEVICLSCGTEYNRGSTSLQQSTKCRKCIRKVALNDPNYKEKHTMVAWTSLHRKTERAALRRDYVFNLELADFIRISGQRCVYCGLPPRHINERTQKKIPGPRAHLYALFANGIDRVDNDIGYLLDNCVSCCKLCNRAKSNLPLDEWNAWLNRITETRLKGM